MTTLTQISKILAYIFHPLNIPLIGLLLLMYLPGTPESFLIADSFYHISHDFKMMLLMLFGLFTWLAPLGTVIMLKRSGEISDLHMDDREERQAPISFMLFYFLVFFALIQFYLPANVIPKSTNSILLGATLGLLAVRIANRDIKVSLHATGMGMLTGAVYVYYNTLAVFPEWLIPLLFILSGIVVSSRILLQKHDLQQSLIGYVIGFVAQYLAGLILF
jgi:hypothetical protein